MIRLSIRRTHMRSIKMSGSKVCTSQVLQTGRFLRPFTVNSARSRR